jgi:XTP/dITP diphosphohydrolase
VKILVATTNKGKIQEITDILGGSDVEVLSIAELGLNLTVIEDGDTFEANAVKKAAAFREASGLNALADDSGLCVDALSGAPGVLSARYAGVAANDQDNIKLLLEKLAGIPDRQAHFVCVAALALTNGDIITARGEFPGLIIDTPRGTGGFGYDPIFLDPVTGKTFAELSLAEKNLVSHRRRALQGIKERLKVKG